MAERRVMRQAETGEGKPCVSLWFCPHQDLGRPGGAAADRRRRIHQGVPGYSGRAHHPVLGCD